MLSLPFHRRYLHRTVWVTLLAWVLALLAGVANACQLQPPGALVSGTATGSPSAERGTHPMAAFHIEHGHHDAHALHDGAAPDDDAAPDAGKAGCLKFCDDESSTMPQGKTAQGDVPGPVLVASINWHSALPTATVPVWRSAERPASQGPPLVIRLLRLTI